MLAARPVEIYRVAVVAYEYPELVLDVECGSGTYIRSLGRDLAEALGTAAVMSALRRAAIGSFRVADAVDPRRLTAENWSALLQPALRAVEYLPRVTLSAAEATRIRNGLAIERAESGGRKEEGGERKAEGGERKAEGGEFSRVPQGRESTADQPQEFAAVDEAGQLVAILIPHGPDQLRPLRNLS